MNDSQRMTALATANANRSARAQLRRQVNDAGNFYVGCCELADVLAAGVPSCMLSMRLEEVLRWPRGRHGCSTDRFIDDVLDTVGCTEWKMLRDLSVRQRSVLVNVLRSDVDMRLAA
jgi:hypothetical protein